MGRREQRALLALTMSLCACRQEEVAEQLPPARADRSGAALTRWQDPSRDQGRVALSVATSPSGAKVSYPGGSALTPALISLPRSPDKVVLHLSKDGMAAEELEVVPDAPRSYFVPLSPHGSLRPSGAGDDWARGALPDAPGQRAEVERFIDSYLDVRLRGCCRRGPERLCGHLLLELLVGQEGAAGRVLQAQAHLVPPHAVTESCISQVLDSIKEQQFTPIRGGTQRFVRSYDFDAKQ